MYVKRRLLPILLALGIAVVVALFFVQPRTSRDERMLSSWLRQAALLSAWDYDHDGRNDTWDYDTNMDGVADLWINMREENLPGGLGRVTIWRKDRDYDGRVDWEMTEMVEPGIYPEPLRSVAEDTNDDGVFDYAALLKGGRRIPSMRSFDTDGDGRYDRVLYYDRHGKIRSEKRCYFLPEVAGEYNGSTDPCGFNYCEYDSDMDGTMDYFKVFTTIGWVDVSQSLLPKAS